MAQNREFRVQTGIVTPAIPGTVKVYANASGQLVSVNEYGSTGSLAGLFAQNISQVGGTITTGVATSAPLGYYGSTGTVFLGLPNQWLVAVGSSGQKLVVPGFLYT